MHNLYNFVLAPVWPSNLFSSLLTARDLFFLFFPDDGMGNPFRNVDITKIKERFWTKRNRQYQYYELLGREKWQALTLKLLSAAQGITGEGERRLQTEKRLRNSGC